MKRVVVVFGIGSPIAPLTFPIFIVERKETSRALKTEHQYRFDPLNPCTFCTLFSAMEANTLVYTRDQLVSILEGFIALLNAPALKEELSALAPDEAKINQAIEARQAAIFQSHGALENH